MPLSWRGRSSHVVLRAARAALGSTGAGSRVGQLDGFAVFGDAARAAEGLAGTVVWISKRPHGSTKPMTAASMLAPMADRSTCAGERVIAGLTRPHYRP